MQGSRAVLRNCSVCGATDLAADEGLPPGWSLATSAERGIEFVCLACTRLNIRAIEGKLPEEWWE